MRPRQKIHGFPTPYKRKQGLMVPRAQTACTIIQLQPQGHLSWRARKFNSLAVLTKRVQLPARAWALFPGERNFYSGQMRRKAPTKKLTVRNAGNNCPLVCT